MRCDKGGNWMYVFGCEIIVYWFGWKIRIFRQSRKLSMIGHFVILFCVLVSRFWLILKYIYGLDQGANVWAISIMQAKGYQFNYLCLGEYMLLLEMEMGYLLCTTVLCSCILREKEEKGKKFDWAWKPYVLLHSLVVVFGLFSLIHFV